MEIKFYGSNCVKISNKKASVVIDDTLEQEGKKAITTDKDISLNTYNGAKYTNSDYFVINAPGEYELSEVSVKSLPVPLHYDLEKTTNMYSIHMGGFSIAVLGHINPNLTDEQLEHFGVVDILVIPVGGGGFTLDPVEAVKIIKSMEPKIVIPTHFSSKNIKYEVDQLPVDEFLKSAGANEAETIDSLKLKENNLPEKTRVIVLNEN